MLNSIFRMVRGDVVFYEVASCIACILSSTFPNLHMDFPLSSFGFRSPPPKKKFYSLVLITLGSQPFSSKSRG